MAYEFSTFFVAFWKGFVHEFFKFFIVSEVNAVPEFRLSVVKVIDTVEIHVFFVPSEHGLPAANINVRVGDSWNFLISKAVSE